MSVMFPEPVDDERYWKDRMDAEKDALMGDDDDT